MTDKPVACPAALVKSDGTVVETTVEWSPMDQRPGAVAEREAIAARAEGKGKNQ